MADDDVATKAPESDAAESNTLPGDTPAQQGASMGVRARYEATEARAKEWSANNVV